MFARRKLKKNRFDLSDCRFVRIYVIDAGAGQNTSSLFEIAVRRGVDTAPIPKIYVNCLLRRNKLITFTPL